MKEFQQNIGGIDTFYLHGGQGEPIVFLHGVPSFSYLWRKVMPLLAADFSCYAPDLPGYARSESLKDYGLKNYSKWLFNFCHHVAFDKKINLVVHDFGGPIGLAFALEHPELTNRLIIMDTLFSTRNLSLPMRFILSSPGVWGYYNLTNKSIFRWSIRMLIYQKDKLNDEDINKYYEVFIRDKKEKTYSKMLEKFRAEIDSLVDDRLSEIDYPTLILWAEKDLILPLSAAERIKSQIKGAQLKTLPNCSHFSQEEEPELVADHIKKFLNEA